MKEDCQHCIDLNFEGHSYVCNCGHSHGEHVLFGPCMRINCECSAYSQTQLKVLAKPRLVPRLAKGASV